jgi:hypothetical protein
MIGRQQSAKAKTNCPADPSDSSGFSRNSDKRTARPNPLSRQGIILKILKRLIRSHQQIVIKKGARFGAGIVAAPNPLDDVFACDTKISFSIFHAVLNGPEGEAADRWIDSQRSASSVW